MRCRVPAGIFHLPAAVTLGWGSRRRSIAAMEADVFFNEKPLRPSVTSSAAQLLPQRTLARPQAAASRTTRPLVSNVEETGTGRRGNTMLDNFPVTCRAAERIPCRPDTKFLGIGTDGSPSVPYRMNTMRKSCPRLSAFQRVPNDPQSRLASIMRPTNSNSGQYPPAGQDLRLRRVRLIRQAIGWNVHAIGMTMW